MDFRAELYARGGYRLDESLVGFFVVVSVVVVFRSADSRRTEKTPATCTATKPATNTVTTTMMIETTTEHRELLHVRVCLVARVMCDDSRALFFSRFLHFFSNNEPYKMQFIY